MILFIKKKCRPCYNEVLANNVQEIRELVVATGRKELRKTVLGEQYSDSQWEDGWDILREDGIYEVEFGDYLIFGLY